MKTMGPVCASQHDSWNCRIGIAFGVLRFVKAFKNTKLLYDWVDIHKDRIMLVVPTYVFHFIQYSVTERNRNHNLRMEVVAFIEDFSFTLQ